MHAKGNSNLTLLLALALLVLAILFANFILNYQTKIDKNQELQLSPHLTPVINTPTPPETPTPTPTL